MNQPKLSKGTIINETLLIEGVIGGGGMGAVYKAKHLLLERPVAVKILFAPADKKEFVKRFQREAKALSVLKHSNIVGFYGFGVWQETVPFIVMEHLEGQSLADLLNNVNDESSESSHCLLPERILKIMTQVCAALSASHREGIIHRDIKPANIMILETPEPDTVKLLDFGLAKLRAKPQQASEDLTKSGILLGTVSYMSPEQGEGKKADARSDIYSLGCLIYQMVSGVEPFTADNPIAVIHKHVHEAAPEIAERILARDQRYRSLAAIAKKCMQKNPLDRFQTVDELSANLGKAEGGELVRFAANRFAAIKKRTSPAAMLAAVLLCLIVGYSFISGTIVMEWLESEILKRSTDKNAWKTALDKAAFYEQRGKNAAALDLLKSASLLAEKNKLNWLQRCKIELRIVRNLHSLGMRAAASAQLKHAIFLCFAFFQKWDKEHVLNLDLQEFREFLEILFQDLRLLNVDLNGLSFAQHNELRDQLTHIQRSLMENENWNESIMMLEFLNSEAEKADRRIRDRSRNPVVQGREDLASCYFQTGRPVLAVKEIEENLKESQQKGNFTDVVASYYNLASIYLNIEKKKEFEEIHKFIEPTFAQLIASTKLREQERFDGISGLVKLAMLYKDHSMSRKILGYLQSHRYEPNFYNSIELVDGWAKLREWKRVETDIDLAFRAIYENPNPDKYSSLCSHLLSDQFKFLNQGYDRDPFPFLKSFQEFVNYMDNSSILSIELLRTKALACCLRAKPDEALLNSQKAVEESQRSKKAVQIILSHYWRAPILLKLNKREDAVAEIEYVMAQLKRSDFLNNKTAAFNAPVQGVAILLAEGKGPQEVRNWLDKQKFETTNRYLRCTLYLAEMLILAEEGKSAEFSTKASETEQTLKNLPGRSELDYDFWLKLAKSRLLVSQGERLEARELMKEIKEDPLSSDNVFDPFSRLYVEFLGEKLLASANPSSVGRSCEDRDVRN